MAKKKVDGPVVEKGDGFTMVTLSGVTVKVSDEALNDFEILDELRALGMGHMVALPALLRRLVGDDQDRVLDALRGENGRVTITAGHRFVMTLLGALNPN